MELVIPQQRYKHFTGRPSLDLEAQTFTRSNDVKVSFPARIWHIAKNYAGIIDSRESITRLALDLSAFDIPVIVSGATRNWKSFLEACLEASWSTMALIFAPFMTKTIAKIAGHFFLDKSEQKDFDKISRFYRGDLDNEDSFKNGVERILNEEPQDLQRISKLYKNIGKLEKSESYAKQSQELKDFVSTIDFSEDKVKRFNKMKEATIVGETFVEGFLWGGFGLGLRWFRKNILKEGRFTGTKKYLNDQESKKLGEGEDLKPFQKILGSSATLIAPLINSTLMAITRDPARLEQSPFLKVLKKSLDFTHGLFPKLGLLFSYTTVPKWFGAFATTQGWDEFIERVMKFFTLIPSWWLGHRVTNGLLASIADKMLAKKYGVERGILLEPHYVGKFAPDPAKIHHVLERTEGNQPLQEEARDLHAKVLYAGMTLHSLGVLGVTMLVNQITKWRVEKKKQAIKG